MVGVAWTRGITRFQNGGGLEFISLGVVFWIVFAQDGGKVRFVGATWVG